MTKTLRIEVTEGMVEAAIAALMAERGKDDWLVSPSLAHDFTAALIAAYEEREGLVRNRDGWRAVAEQSTTTLASLIEDVRRLERIHREATEGLAESSNAVVDAVIRCHTEFSDELAALTAAFQHPEFRRQIREQVRACIPEHQYGVHIENIWLGFCASLGRLLGEEG